MHKSDVLLIFAGYGITYCSQLLITAVRLAFAPIVPAISSTSVSHAAH